MGSARRQFKSQGPRPPIRAATPARTVEWLSPKADDSFAEYRDAGLLDRRGIGELTPAFALIVEAQAHIDEMLSPSAQSSGGSRGQIEANLKSCADALDAMPKAAWTEMPYQFANRIAHLWFLRAANKPAWLELVNFLNDDEMDGPASPREWDAPYRVALHVLGLKCNHALARYFVRVHPDVRHLGRAVE